MKYIKLFSVALFLSFALSGCYTKLATDDPYEKEYSVIKSDNVQNPQQNEDDVEYDTVYVDDNGNPIEDDQNASSENTYYINNYYNDYDIYHHYFDTYTPCFYCDPFYVGGVGGLIVVGGWYYYSYPPYYYYPGYIVYPPTVFYPYPPYYYDPYFYPYPKTKTRRYYAGLRNNFGRNAMRSGFSHSRRRSGTVATSYNGNNPHGNSSRKGRQVNLDDLTTGTYSGGNNGNANGTKLSSDDLRKKRSGKDFTSSKKKKSYRTSPPVHQKRKEKINAENQSVQQKKRNKNYTISPPVHKNGKGRITQERKPKKKVIIYKKYSTSNNRAGSLKKHRYERRSGKSDYSRHQKSGYKSKSKSRSKSYGRSSSRYNDSSRRYTPPSRSSRSGSMRTSGSSRSYGGSRSRGGNSRNSRRGR